MIYGLILSAGNESRFNADYPKALSTIQGKVMLDINIQHMEEVCDKVYVVCSTTNYHLFEKYSSIIIKSGKGCGDAVLKALCELPLRDDDTVLIQWGDSLTQTSNILKLMCAEYEGRLVIPIAEEDTPYVQIIPAEDKYHAKVLFSKYGENIDIKGYHDMSVFYGDAKTLLFYLEKFASKYETDVGYDHPHGNELQFLDLLNETEIEVKLVDLNCITIAFNTIEEYNKIKHGV